MCGIAGIVRWDGSPIPEHEIRDMCSAHRPPRPRRPGRVLGEAGARHAPPVHHRPRAAATSRSPTRTARSGSSSTARSTTTASCARELERRGHASAPTATPRSSSISTRSAGDACRRSAARHVRVRHLGRASGAAAARARSLRHQAAVLRRRGAASLRAPSSSRSCSCRRRRARSTGALAIPVHVRLRPRAEASWTASRSSSRRAPPSRRAPDAAPAYRRYWDVRSAPNERATRGRAVERAARAARATRSRSHQVSDVPVGAFLSRRHRFERRRRADGAARRRHGCKTFSIGFEEAGFDELRYARHVAAQFDTDHHEVVVTPDVGASSSRI